MALQVNRASRALSPKFLGSSGAVAIGAIAAAVLTDYGRDEVYDIPMKGGDLVYGLAGAALTLALLGGTTGRMLAAGMVAGGATSTLSNDFNAL